MKSNFKVGVLGGGQLGKMMALAAQNWDLNIWCLDKSKDFPAGVACNNLVEGDFKNFDDVYNFGKMVDVLTIEIEHVNTDALLKLEEEGLKIHPSPTALNLIKDKGLQKLFYQKYGIPTAKFDLYESGESIKAAIADGSLKTPFVQKARSGGYDGNGVAVIKNEADFEKIMPTASMVEPMVNIAKELAVVVARNENGDIVAYPPVEMEFNPIANLVEFLVCPADISDSIAKEAEALAKNVIEKFDMCGLLAVELFLTPDNQILVNEVAPRPHNSGHHTIDSCYTSQFQQHLRGILNLPLGSTKMKSPSVMVNLLGTAGHTGPAQYPGFAECMGIEGAKFHLYGKKMTKPFRKMGHATILDTDIEKAKEKGRLVMEKFLIITR